MARIRNVAAAIVLVAAIAAPALAQSIPPVKLPIRFAEGLAFEIPADWRLSQISVERVALHREAGKDTFAKTNRNAFVLRVEGYDDYKKAGESWVRIERSGSQTLANGAKVEWWMGRRWIDNDGHYAYGARISFNYAYMTAGSLSARERVPEPEVFARTLLALAGSLRKAQRGVTFYHPAGMQVVELGKLWASKSTAGAFGFSCNWCGFGSNVGLYAYAPTKPFPSDEAMLKDLTDSGEKTYGLKAGGVNRLALEGGQLIWSEQQGAKGASLTGVIRRGDRRFWVAAYDTGEARFGLDNLRPHFLLLATGLKPWDGR